MDKTDSTVEKYPFFSMGFSQGRPIYSKSSRESSAIVYDCRSVLRDSFVFSFMLLFIILVLAVISLGTFRYFEQRRKMRREQQRQRREEQFEDLLRSVSKNDQDDSIN